MSNPISALLEYCKKEGLPDPAFDIVSVTGESHLPLFVIEAKLNDLVGRGSGNAKKKAKNAAAQELYNQVLQQAGNLAEADHENSLAIKEMSRMTIKPATVRLPTDGIFNPIGKLQELCMLKNLPPPRYDTLSERGPAHDKSFTLSCRVGTLVYNGSASKKKDAKHFAAAKLLEELESNPDLNARSINMCFDNRVDEDKPDSKPLLMIKDLTEGLKSEEINDQLESDILEVSVQILDDITKTNNLELSHFEIEDQSCSGQFQHLIRFNTGSEAVCFGTGGSREKAKQVAAVDALSYIKTMTDIEFCIKSYIPFSEEKEDTSAKITELQ